MGRGRSRRPQQNEPGAGREAQNQSGSGRGAQNQSGAGRGAQNQSGAGRGAQNQSGAGRGAQNNSGAGRGAQNNSGGRAQQTAFVAAPVQATVWGTPAASAATPPAPIQSAWGPPAVASSQSAWGPPAGPSSQSARVPPAGANGQSAWGPPAGPSSQSARVPPAKANGQSAWGPPAGPSSQSARVPPAGANGQSAWGPPAGPSSQSARVPPAGANGQSAGGPPAGPSSQSARVPPAGANGQSARGPPAGASSQSARVPPAGANGQSARGPPAEASGESAFEPPVTRGYSGSGGVKGIGKGRGSIRDKKIISDILRTKPDSINSKIGDGGRLVDLTTNYFRLVKKPTWQIYQYRVDFSPEIAIPGLRNRLIAEQKTTLGGYLFDGTMLFLTVKLHKETTVFMSKDREGKPIQTTIKFVKLVSMTSGASVQILNLILRRSIDALNLQLVGRNYFDAIAKIRITLHNLELWPGYVTSIRQHEQDILMCAEVANKVMRTETVFDILKKHLGYGGEWQISFAEEVIGMTVLTSFNNKTYRIDDIDYQSSPMQTFVRKDGPVTYVDYYRAKHNITINDMTQPLLLSRLKDRDIRAGRADVIALIPELCRATGMTDQMRNNRPLMDAVAVYTRLRPGDRIQKLNEFNTRLQTAPASVAHLAEWNFRLDTNLVRVQGRELQNEKIFFANGRTFYAAEWSQYFRNNSMYTSQHLDNWVVIVPRLKRGQADAFIDVLQQASNGMRYRVADPVIIEVNDDRATSYAMMLDKALNRDPQLIMCILLSFSADKYSTIKKKCCVQRAVPSQVMLSRTITPKPGRDARSLMSVGTKVAIQMNCKLGGAAWMVDIPLSELMVVGFDVCHDTTNKSKSYGAMVATMDMKFAQNYFSAVSSHRDGNELSNELALNLIKAVKCYFNQHKYLPKRIMIYRDGVGEGQTNFVFEHELENVIDKLNQFYRGQEYKLTFIIVSKRINTRFFKGSDNPVAGTVVDSVVTLPERYDFFLIPQTVRTGTVSPTNFNVIYDKSKLTPSNQQVFAYKMCHLYYNWSGTLAVPAVCQYAHKLAFLVSNCIHQSPSSLLEKQLYFL